MAALRGVVRGGGLGGDFAIAVAGGGGRGIIGPAGGPDRRRPAASAAIKGLGGGGDHDRDRRRWRRILDEVGREATAAAGIVGGERSLALLGFVCLWAPCYASVPGILQNCK
jgi:hypothetical protein